MAIRTFPELTWAQMRELGSQGALAMVAVGPLEDHGPHLPAGTDLYLAQGFVKGLAVTLERRTGKDVVLLPSIPLGAQLQYALGCLRLPANTLRSALLSLGRELAREGFRHCVVVTAHGAASHLAGIEIACRQASRGKFRMVSPSGPLMLQFLRGKLREPLERTFGRPFTTEEWAALSVDYHAGAWETSMMLRFHPDLVGDYKRLPPFSWKEGLTNSPGYFGSPALASERLGQAAIDLLGERAADYVLARLEAKPARSYWWLRALAGGAGLALAARKGWEKQKARRRGGRF